MTYYDVDAVLYAVSLGGCLLAFMLSMRHGREACVLAFVYGAWISYFYLVFHALVPATFHGVTAPKLLHCWWYLINAVSQSVIVFCGYYLRDAPARKPLMVFGGAAAAVCFAYFGASFVGSPLPGRGYFVTSASAEALQVLSLIICSGPVVPILKKAFGFLKNKEDSWTHHKRLAQ